MATVAGIFWNINVFDIPGVGLIGIEQNEIGEIIIAFRREADGERTWIGCPHSVRSTLMLC